MRKASKGGIQGSTQSAGVAVSRQLAPATKSTAKKTDTLITGAVVRGKDGKLSAGLTVGTTALHNG